MSSLTHIIEAFLSIHILFAVSSLCIGGHWLVGQPSHKLFLARLMFVSCVASPVAVHLVKKSNRPFFSTFVPFDALQDHARMPALDLNQSKLLSTQALHTKESNFGINWNLVLISFFLGLLYNVHHFMRNLRRLQSILRISTPYRSKGRLSIKVSDRCQIPFSTRLFGTAYIVLPVSMLHSPINMKIAIAHEGQHHRQGDCLWAYFVEFICMVFWGNPGMHRWHRILGELQELSCDEALVGHQLISAHDYGHCLFEVAQAVSTYSKTNHRKFACAVGMAWSGGEQEKSFITRRICMLSKYQPQGSQRSIFGVALAASVMIGPFCTAYVAKGALSPAVGQEINLSSVNLSIQQIAAAEITAAVTRYHATSGAIAVADFHTGKIVAFAESGAIQGPKSWKWRLFTPGSTIKPFIAAAAIDAGVASETQNYDCRQPYVVSGTKFTNGNRKFGMHSLTEAISQSINICLIRVAQDLGSKKLRESLSRFGFDMDSAWRIDGSDALQLANASLGSNIPVTIETMARAYAILANKGHVFQPTSAAAISEESADATTRMLIEAVAHGTGKLAAIPGMPVAGKTGTLKQDDTSYLALFGGYAPADSPQFVSYVVIENGHRTDKKEKESGGALAAPVFHNTAANSLAILGG